MKRAAFTLVELLVVLSVLALLMALLFPLLASSRQQARAVACRANIGQLLLSLQNYETEHQSLPYGFDVTQRSPPPGGCQGNSRFDTPGWWWFDFAGVIPYRSRKQMKLLCCPSSRLTDPSLDADILCGNYGVNRALCRNKADISGEPLHQAFLGPPLSTGNLHSPGATLLLVDSGYSLICWWQATPEPPAVIGDQYIEDTSYVPGLALNKDRKLWAGQFTDAVGGRHPNRTVNVGFADGHSERRKAEELLVEKTEEGYTNTLLWHAQKAAPIAAFP